MNSQRMLKTGGDPRGLPDFTSLRDELSKLTHPARPDVNWLYAEKLCLSLFEQNGAELQTAAWYTLTRMQLAGVGGLNEGLAILAVLISRQWGSLWPQSPRARMEILSALSKRLQQMMRTLTLSYADLPQLHQALQHISYFGEVLQKRELTDFGQTEALRVQLHNTVVRLENSVPPGLPSASTSETLTASTTRHADTIAESDGYHQWVFVAPSESTVNIAPPVRWKAFVAGMALMLVAGGASLWGWQACHRAEPLVAQLNTSLAVAPEPLTMAQLQVLRQQKLQPEVITLRTRQQLERLSLLPPDSTFRQETQLIQQLRALFPDNAEVRQLASQWRHQQEATALAPQSLNGWYQGMMKLQQLANQLNALDEKRGKYMTVSELKSQVFTITQLFSQTPPVEERLRQFAQQSSRNQALAVAIDSHLRQLLARYSLLMDRENDHNEINNGGGVSGGK